MTRETSINKHYVEKFALQMQDRLAIKATEGRGGWWDPKQCSTDDLRKALIRKVANGKGDPIDIANYAMMIYWREPSATNAEISRCIREMPVETKHDT